MQSSSVLFFVMSLRVHKHSYSPLPNCLGSRIGVKLVCYSNFKDSVGVEWFLAHSFIVINSKKCAYFPET